MGHSGRTTRKVLVLILDGLGDLPVDALGGQTPLEAAVTPVLDGWVARGRCGLVDPVAPGITVETHVGTGTLMGLTNDQVASFPRGPIEAAGAGLDLGVGDIALRTNFATLEGADGELNVRDRRAGRIDEGIAELVAAINDLAAEDGVNTFIEPLSRHRAALKLSGPGLSGAITDTDPGAGGNPRRLRWSRAQREGDAAAERTAAVLNRFLRRAHDVLHDHPVNRDRVRRGLHPASGLLTRGAGVRQSPDGLVRRLGLTGAVVAGDRTVLGLATLLGFQPVLDEAFTATIETDLEAKAIATREALAGHDIVWMHVKATDIASHDRQPEAKREFIERIDAAIHAIAGPDLVIGVSGDHTTDSNTGRHTEDPVPSLMLAPGVQRDDVVSFGESRCRVGGLGRLTASEFLLELLAAAGRLPPERPDHSPR